jgi:hypothetical protein
VCPFSERLIIRIYVFSHSMCVTIDWVWISELDSLTTYTRLGTTSNYSAPIKLHNSQITIAAAKPLSSLLYLHQPFPRNGFNSGDSSASRAQVLS